MHTTPYTQDPTSHLKVAPNTFATLQNYNYGQATTTRRTPVATAWQVQRVHLTETEIDQKRWYELT